MPGEFKLSSKSRKSKNKPSKAAKGPSPAALAFQRMVHANTAKGRPPLHARLHNLTFWAGAGFAKAWDPRAPLGTELFTVPKNLLETMFHLTDLQQIIGSVLSADEVSFDEFKQLVYTLDMQDRHPEIRSRYFDAYNISKIRDGLRSSIAVRLEDLAPKVYLNPQYQKFAMTELTDSQKSMLDFFRALQTHADGSSGLAEGLRFHFITTNYDFIVETILDNILDEDDSHFFYTYRGITPSRIVDFRTSVEAHDHWLVQHLLKINGGFEILRERDQYYFDYTQRDDAQIRSSAPNIILPSREQVYTDPYFREVFAKSVRLLRESDVLIIVGYSLPAEDALIRFILRQFAERGEDGAGKQIFYIDLMSEMKMRERIVDVFPSAHDFGAPSLYLYQGSFDSFARECLPLIS